MSRSRQVEVVKVGCRLAESFGGLLLVRPISSLCGVRNWEKNGREPSGRCVRLCVGNYDYVELSSILCTTLFLL